MQAFTAPAVKAIETFHGVIFSHCLIWRQTFPAPVPYIHLLPKSIIAALRLGYCPISSIFLHGTS